MWTALIETLQISQVDNQMPWGCLVFLTTRLGFKLITLETLKCNSEINSVFDCFLSFSTFL